MLNLNKTHMKSLMQKRYVQPQMHIVDLCEDVVCGSEICTGKDTCPAGYEVDQLILCPSNDCSVVADAY